MTSREPCVPLSQSLLLEAIALVSMEHFQLTPLLDDLFCPRFGLPPYRLCRPQSYQATCVHQHVLVADREKLRVVLAPFLPHELRDEVFGAENLIHQQLQVRSFVVIDRDQYHAFILKEIAGDIESRKDH